MEPDVNAEAQIIYGDSAVPLKLIGELTVEQLHGSASGARNDKDRDEFEGAGDVQRIRLAAIDGN